MSMLLSMGGEQWGGPTPRVASELDGSEPAVAPGIGASSRGDVLALPARTGGDCDLVRLFDALESLGAMPAPRDLADLAPRDARDLVRGVQRAARWLAAFADELGERCLAATVHA
jgi:hypothetical protein